MTTTEAMTDAQLRDCWHALEVSSAAVRTRVQHEIQRGTGLPASWSDVLLLLSDAPDGRQPMHVATRRIGLTSGGFTKLADRMERAGMLTRDHSTGDRRVVYLALTEQGALKATETAAIQATVLRRQLAAVSSEELRSLTEAMRSVQESAASSA